MQPGQLYGGEPDCTNRQTTVDPIGHEGENDDAAHILFRGVSALGPLLAHRKNWSRAVLGHVNWWPVTFTGLVSFDESGGADRDVNFALEPDGGRAPMTRKQRAPDQGLECPDGAPAGARCLPQEGRLHLEINAAQATKHFSSSSADEPAPFPDLAQLTEPESRRKLRERIFRKRARATGLLCIDLDHEVFAELHPLYSLAWQDACTGGAGEEWGILFANAGHQGWVSSGLNHYLALKAPTFVIELPSELSGTNADLASVIAKASVRLFSNSAASYSLGPAADGRHVALRLSWSGGETEEVRVHGTVALPWPDGALKCPQPAPAVPAPMAQKKTVAAHRVEDLGGAMERFLESGQFDQFLKARGGPPVPAPPPPAKAAPEDIDATKVTECAGCNPPSPWPSPPWGASCPGEQSACDFILREVQTAAAARQPTSTEIADFRKRTCAMLDSKEGRARLEEAYGSFLGGAPERQAEARRAEVTLKGKVLDRMREFACQQP